MSRKWLIGTIALALLGGATVRADDPPAKPGHPLVLRELRALLGTSSDYWLGLAVTPVSDSLRAQLSLPEGQGLLVENVLPGSPAAKAGIRQFDVLLKAGDKPLKETADLLGAIEKGKEGKLAIELVRGGKTQTVTATPEKRPGEGPATSEGGEGPEGEEVGILKLFGNMEKAMPDGGNFQFHVLHPGQILPPGATWLHGNAKDVHVTVKTEATLPDGYKVEIVRKDATPAKITLTHGEEKWEATEGDLGKLPEKIRPEVQRMLPRGLLTLGGTAVLPEPGAVAPNVRSLVPDPRVERRLDEITRRLEELGKEFKKFAEQGEQIRPPEFPTIKPPAEKPAEKKPEKPPAEGRRI